MDAKRDGCLSKKLRIFDRYHLLLIDELGYIPFEREATDLLFQIISERYESKSIAITTNLPFEEWNQVFPTAMAATAVIDRLVHHGSVFEFKGQSHRLRTRGGTGKQPSGLGQTPSNPQYRKPIKSSAPLPYVSSFSFNARRTLKSLV